MANAGHFKVSIPTLAIILAAAGSPRAATFADGFSEQVIATKLNPTAMEIAPDGRIFVCSKAGALRVVKNGQLLAKPFVTLPALNGSEQGLLGITFHPNFPDSNWVYVFYTADNPQHNRISRFRADGDTALGGIGGEKILFDLDNTTAGNHNSGAIHFGKDGKLYIASGNSAESSFSQNINTTLGKILRLNPDGSIPDDNPFLAQTTGKAKANWTTGMRNTFTFSVDPVTGRFFGCEVGDGWEEVNELIGGSNYGYGKQEGYDTVKNTAGMVGTVKPAIYAYNGGGCIIAAAFYSPGKVRNFPAEFHRKFFFADHKNGWIKVLAIDAPKTVTNFATEVSQPVDIKFAADGSMYYADRGTSGGSLYKVTFAGGPVGLAPAIHGGRSSGHWPAYLDQGALTWPVDASDAIDASGRVRTRSPLPSR